MIKYVILSVIAYYVFTYYVSPLLDKKIVDQNEKKQKKADKHDDEYIDYEEVK